MRRLGEWKGLLAGVVDFHKVNESDGSALAIIEFLRPKKSKATPTDNTVVFWGRGAARDGGNSRALGH